MPYRFPPRGAVRTGPERPSERGSRAGSSALLEYRRRRSRRRRVRAWTGLAGIGLLAGGIEAGRVGSWRIAAALSGAGAVLLALLAWDGYGGADVARWRRGAEGEVATEDLLAGLSSRRWAVWHDIAVRGSRANVDHVVVGRTGVWVIDSKATRAVVRAGWGAVRFGDRKLDTSPVRWEAEVVRDLIASASVDGAAPGVKAIVVVHGHGLRRRGGRAGGIRVVPAGELVRRLRRGRRRLRRGQVERIVAALSEEVGPPDQGRAPRRVGGARA